jgi:hypothetical protein
MTVAHEPLVSLARPASRAVREIRHLALVRSEPDYVQGALALTYPLSGGVADSPSAAERPPAETDRAPSRSADSPPRPEPWAARYVQAVVEVLAQRRPISQLARWTSAEVFNELTRRTRRPSGSADRCRPARQSVVSVRVCAIGADAAEVAARVTDGDRSRAIAARLDFRRGRWTCTALTLG